MISRFMEEQNNYINSIILKNQVDGEYDEMSLVP